MKKQILLTLSLIVSTTYLTLNAQNWNEIINATASDAGTGDYFGYSVAIDGDYAIVGANLNDDAGGSSGSAYIFVRSGNNWTAQTKLTASDAAAGDQFGTTVAIDGDYAIVGAYANSDAGGSSGSAYIFERSGNSWTEQTKLTASDAATADFFGYSVAIDGDYAIVGAFGNDDAGGSSGSTYIFVRLGGSWAEQTKLTASDAAASDYFGYSVAIDGDYAIVGAYGNDDAGNNSGSAYIFVRSGSTWTEQEELTAFDTAGGDQFGSSVSIAGDYAIVGAFGNDDAGSSSGSAYIFVRSGSSWTEQVKLTASDAAAIDIFGNSVSIAGDYAIVGAFGNDDAGNSSGSAYIFVRSGNSWAEEEKLTASDAAAGDQFGYSVAIQGDYVIVGANGNDDNGNSSGSAYFFEKEPPAIVPDQTNLPDVTSQCEATPTAPTANSGTITATADVVFPITTQGTTIVTWTYNDGVGNTLTQLQNIIIDDTTAPILSFSNPSDALIDSCATEVIVPSPVIVENCTINTTLDFDGTNDRVTIPYSASLAFTTEFSVQAWIYPRANSYSRILTKYSGGGNNQGEFVFDTYDGSIPTYYANGRGLRLAFTGPNGGSVLSPNVLNLNTWNHVVGTFNNGIIKIYVNGVEVNSGTTIYTSIPTSSLDYAIGEDIFVNQNEYFSGQIDELSIWNKALKPSEITSGYNKILEGTESGLAAYYDFEEGTGSSVLIDKSSNGNDGLLTNMDSNTDWIASAAPITMVSLTNDITGTSDASGTYPEGETIVTWTATDTNGNQSTLEQIVNIVCSITYTFNNDVWSPNNPSGLATALDDIIVTSGNAAINSNTSANTVTVEAGASLTLDAALTATDITLNSTSTSYSSLLIGASGNVSGTINYNRFVNSNSLGNDLISSPLSGETWSNFLSSENATALLDNGGTPIIYAFAPFDKTTGDYENYDSNTTAILSSGKGYRAATDTGETLTFSGTVPTDVSVNIMNTATAYSQWNLVGNPYPSYINVHAFLNHEVDTGISNLDLFTNASAAIYGYNANEENSWTIYNLANTTVSTVIAPGQGFFVSADGTYESAYNLEFTTAMQTIGTSDDFIAGRNADLELIYLTIDLSSNTNTNTNTNTYNTDVYFNANASEGLDKGYDAELWGTVVPEFSIYSHLVQDNTGKPIALQTLNATSLSNISIPLGVHANLGEQITFSISETTLPATVNVFLDDVLTNTSTLLNNSDYTITPSTDLSGTGRFFLRTTEEALSITDNNFDAINIFYEKRAKDVLISGRIQNNTVVEVYDMQGRKVLSSLLDSTVLENRIHVASLNAGVYLVHLKNSSEQKTQKIIIN
ncbi:LamG-like jellyroll fold domain-containing protein [Winogradskyella ludwigii]|uniref:LamG-like jellyroll fold domain-containing protein n=1 Tax=Winogradskyella ludwigii TaxID=2686076 RepID=UPI0015CCE34A|nr:LamG-like jellyroll fold domain-containing protein [Winogradskyella ludwigii]